MLLSSLSWKWFFISASNCQPQTPFPLWKYWFFKLTQEFHSLNVQHRHIFFSQGRIIFRSSIDSIEIFFPSNSWTEFVTEGGNWLFELMSFLLCFSLLLTHTFYPGMSKPHHNGISFLVFEGHRAPFFVFFSRNNSRQLYCPWREVRNVVTLGIVSIFEIRPPFMFMCYVRFLIPFQH